MARLIDADRLEKEMYHEAFETDSDMQKWDSGCWIRYKLFENCIEKQPTADVAEVVRCKDCKYYCANYCTRDIKGRTNMFYMEDDDFCSYGKKVE